ncbi:glycerophosphoryl diester phosphodiesterase [Sphingopyxis panaciterrae]|uniref:glycerophosphodiester phosphodiesterase family protein n=1 Tax=Sphingopyxis panaciterrae TaxID=363841 RepID=UPI00141E0572|nr:glycerophosphodiester phosphodiesterase family protein [Sphingopyxis panaciterrae]NIJ38630.1 glycerophosphoryl diester phosphodiesterase [Sphingopyxis panaciterrae]
MADSDDWAAALEGPPKKPMRRGTKIFLWVFAAVVAWFTLSNASWLAPDPAGKPKLIAHRGVHHLYDKRAAAGRDTCTARYIAPPRDATFENTPESMRRAVGLGANMVEVDVAPTKDGRMVLFHDWTLDCRTDGKGDTRDLTLAELKALDIGYGYTADGGRTFPLRGKGVGLMPTVEDGLAALPVHPILFNFKSKDPAEADRLFRILNAAGRDSAKIGDAFYGAERPVQRMRELLPRNWSFDLRREALACSKDYVTWGWTGIVPASCRNGVLAIPINYQWAYWGWPDRLIQRMDSVGARIIVFGPYESGKANEGLTTPQQLARVPASFNGYIWVEDIREIGPALRPRQK